MYTIASKREGKATLGCFIPATVVAFSHLLNRGETRIYFGSTGDRPVLGGAIFRDDDGLWAVHGSSRYYFGGQGDLPASR